MTNKWRLIGLNSLAATQLVTFNRAGIGWQLFWIHNFFQTYLINIFCILKKQFLWWKWEYVYKIFSCYEVQWGRYLIPLWTLDQPCHMEDTHETKLGIVEAMFKQCCQYQLGFHLDEGGEGVGGEGWKGWGRRWWRSSPWWGGCPAPGTGLSPAKNRLDQIFFCCRMVSNQHIVPNQPMWLIHNSGLI